MTQKLYVVYSESGIYLVKAQNKKEAINFAYSEFGHNEFKKDFIALNLEKELFKRGGFDRKVVMLD